MLPLQHVHRMALRLPRLPPAAACLLTTAPVPPARPSSSSSSSSPCGPRMPLPSRQWGLASQPSSLSAAPFPPGRRQRRLATFGPWLFAPPGLNLAPFSSSSSSSEPTGTKPPAFIITRGDDKASFEQLLREKLDAPLGFLDEGTLKMWRSQGPHVRCLYYAAFAGEGEGELLGFVTAYEVERDPLGKHKRPHLLNLVYVQPHHRHRGVAVELIRRAASELQVAALCSSPEYIAVCEKAGLEKGDCGALAPIVVMAN